MEKISYALGISLGNNLKNGGFAGLSYQKLADGIKDVIEGNQLEMSIDRKSVV